MELSELKTFVEIASKGSFSAAADALFLTQPAVSKRLAALEADLGCLLFDRIGRRIALTQTGKALLPQVKIILSETEDIKRLARKISGEIAGPLLLGTSHHIGLHRLPPLLRDYTSRFPKVSLDIRFLDSETACRQIETGELEVAIVTLPSSPPPILKIENIWTDPLVFVASDSHPLALASDPELFQLVEYPAVLPGPTTFTRAILDREIANNNLTLNIGMSTNYMETLKMLVQTGQGWSLLPQSMVDSSLQTIGIPVKLSRNLGIVTHTQRTLSNGAHAFIHILQTSRDATLND